MEIPIFKFALMEGLSDDFLPKKANNTDTGWDVRSTEDIVLTPKQYIKIPLGIKVFAPEGWWLELRPRSSTFAKKSLHALYGVIDCSYENEVLFACQWCPNEDELINRKLQIQKGEAIGQIIPVKRQEMIIERITNEEFEKACKERNHTRGKGGFGSSG